MQLLAVAARMVCGLVARHTGSPSHAGESLWCATGWSRLEERKERGQAQLLNSRSSPIISEGNR